jgi:hypothetical protein
MRYDLNGRPIPANAQWDGQKWAVPPSSYADVDIAGMPPNPWGYAADIGPIATAGLAQSFKFNSSPEPMGNSIRRMLNDLYGGADGYKPLAEMQWAPPPPAKDAAPPPPPPVTREEWGTQHQQNIASENNQRWLASLSPENRKLYSTLQQY